MENYETILQNIENKVIQWQSEKEMPGILFCHYKEYKFKLIPVGSFEYDSYINDLRSSIIGDDVDSLLYELICHVENIKIDKTITITLIR